MESKTDRYGNTEEDQKKFDEAIDVSTKEGFLMFLGDTTQEYVDSINNLDELSVVALLLWSPTSQPPLADSTSIAERGVL